MYQYGLVALAIVLRRPLTSDEFDVLQAIANGDGDGDGDKDTQSDTMLRKVLKGWVLRDDSTPKTDHGRHKSSGDGDGDGDGDGVLKVVTLIADCMKQHGQPSPMDVVDRLKEMNYTMYGDGDAGTQWWRWGWRWSHGDVMVMVMEES